MGFVFLLVRVFESEKHKKEHRDDDDDDDDGDKNNFFSREKVQR